MSTHWGYKCKTCGTTSECTGNHVTDILIDGYQNRHTIQKLRQHSWHVECKFEYGPYGDELQFLCDHKDHELCLYNEYGETCELPEEKSTDPKPPRRIFRELVSGDGLRGGIVELPNDVPRTVKTVVYKRLTGMMGSEALPVNNEPIQESREFEFEEKLIVELLVYKEK